MAIEHVIRKVGAKLERTGIGLTRVTQSQPKDAIISLPPLAERLRIVANVTKHHDALKACLADTIVEQAVASPSCLRTITKTAA